ncbi:hypothetical protein D3C87_1856330 [compost metagenome]
MDTAASVAITFLDGFALRAQEIGVVERSAPSKAFPQILRGAGQILSRQHVQDGRRRTQA